MSRTLLAMTAAALLCLAVATPATADEHERVVAYNSEFTPVHVWHEPVGCNVLPFATHVIVNETDRPIRVYADPVCLVPLEPTATVFSGDSTHVSSVGSFRA
jgi:hypothetical protein